MSHSRGKARHRNTGGYQHGTVPRQLAWDVWNKISSEFHVPGASNPLEYVNRTFQGIAHNTATPYLGSYKGSYIITEVSQVDRIIEEVGSPGRSDKTLAIHLKFPSFYPALCAEMPRLYSRIGRGIRTLDITLLAKDVEEPYPDPWRGLGGAAADIIHTTIRQLESLPFLEEVKLTCSALSFGLWGCQVAFGDLWRHIPATLQTISIELSDNDIGHQGCRVLIHAFCDVVEYGSSHIKHLYLGLRRNNIEWRGAQTLSPFKDLEHLESLDMDLEGNLICDNGARALSLMLNRGGGQRRIGTTNALHTLKLNLKNNEIGDRGAKYFSAEGMKELDVWGGDAYVPHIHLNLEQNRIGGVGLRQIAAWWRAVVPHPEILAKDNPGTELFVSEVGAWDGLWPLARAWRDMRDDVPWHSLFPFGFR
jgi:hypothetical protein